MFGVFKFFCLLLLHSASARLTRVPTFYGQDSAIIVDTDKQFPAKLNPKLQNALYYNMPVYKLIKPFSLTTTTPAPQSNEPDQYPSDLIYLARHKLGLKRLDNLPSISELGDLLGTGSASETIKYIRVLTSNEQGIALMKSYLDSLDAVDEESPAESSDEDDNSTNNGALIADYDGESNAAVATTTKAPPESSFMQSMGEFIKQYNLWPEDGTSTPSPPKVAFKPITFTSSPSPAPMRPMFVRHPLPYHYPIPLRPVLVAHPPKVASPKLSKPATTTPRTTTPPPSPAPPPPPHLNSPKRVDKETEMSANAPVAPHVRQLAKFANVSPQLLNRILQQQPKLADLARRVSIDPNLLRQFSLPREDELKRLLNVEETLK